MRSAGQALQAVIDRRIDAEESSLNRRSIGPLRPFRNLLRKESSRDAPEKRFLAQSNKSFL
jgi:hypothetical protein